MTTEDTEKHRSCRWTWNGPLRVNDRLTVNLSVGRAVLAGPNVCCAGQDSRSRGDFFVQSCLPTRAGLVGYRKAEG